jgi:hypothetical protein
VDLLVAPEPTSSFQSSCPPKRVRVRSSTNNDVCAGKIGEPGVGIDVDADVSIDVDPQMVKTRHTHGFQSVRGLFRPLAHLAHRGLSSISTSISNLRARVNKKPLVGIRGAAATFAISAGLSDDSHIETDNFELTREQWKREASEDFESGSTSGTGLLRDPTSHNARTINARVHIREEARKEEMKQRQDLSGIIEARIAETSSNKRSESTTDLREEANTSEFPEPSFVIYDSISVDAGEQISPGFSLRLLGPNGRQRQRRQPPTEPSSVQASSSTKGGKALGAKQKQNQLQSVVIEKDTRVNVDVEVSPREIEARQSQDELITVVNVLPTIVLDPLFGDGLLDASDPRE